MIDLLTPKNLIPKTELLDELRNAFIGIELRGGNKVFGNVEKYTDFYIYIKNKDGDVLDVPRRIITRAFLLIDGGKEKDGQ